MLEIDSADSRDRRVNKELERESGEGREDEGEEVIWRVDNVRSEVHLLHRMFSALIVE